MEAAVRAAEKPLRVSLIHCVASEGSSQRRTLVAFRRTAAATAWIVPEVLGCGNRSKLRP